jgi:hypothetical protein
MKTLQERAGFLLQAVACAAFMLVAPPTLAGPAPTDEPYTADVFVRGSFNGWDVSDPMRYDAAAGRYIGLVQLSAGVEHAFKIASQDWFSVDFGDVVDPVVAVEVPKTLATSTGGGNLSLEVPVAGVYAFILDPTDAANPVLTVSYARPGNEGVQSGAQIWHGTYHLDWYFQCLGQAVDATIYVKAQLLISNNPAGGFIYSENLQTSGSAVDSGGGKYAVRDARINNYLVQPGGSEIYQNRSRLRMRSLTGGPDLLATMITRYHIAADGELVRYVEFEDLACGN